MLNGLAPKLVTIAKMSDAIILQQFIEEKMSSTDA